MNLYPEYFIFKSLHIHLFVLVIYNDLLVLRFEGAAAIVIVGISCCHSQKALGLFVICILDVYLMFFLHRAL